VVAQGARERVTAGSGQAAVLKEPDMPKYLEVDTPAAKQAG